MLSLASLDDYQSLKPDAWGIPSISKESIAGRRDGIRDGLDLVLMPGVAFDETFGRLGHGKGYYDYFLARYKKETGKSPLLVALAFGEQLLGKGEVPMDVMDWPVDIIVTGDGGCLRRRDLLPN